MSENPDEVAHTPTEKRLIASAWMIACTILFLDGAPCRQFAIGLADIHRLGSLCLLRTYVDQDGDKRRRNQKVPQARRSSFFYQAVREIERVPPIPSQTSLRIWETPLC